jgi:GNAT superfamily N-acetyltransferase
MMPWKFFTSSKQAGWSPGTRWNHNPGRFHQRCHSKSEPLRFPPIGLRACDARDLAKPADQAAIVALVHEANAVCVPRIGRPPAPMLEDDQALIANGCIHVRENETGIASIVVFIPEERAMLPDNVTVKVAAQGRGYGRMLIAFAEAAARNAG